MTSYPPLSDLAKAILWRVNEVRADKLRRTGEDYRWSDLARAVGWSQPTASVIKTGKRPISLDELPRIAAALNVRIEWLAFGSGPMREATGGGAARVGREPEEVVAVRPIAAPAKRRAR